MKRSKFNLSHYRLLTGNMGKLYPAGLVEVLPGDTFQHNSSMLLRLSPMAAPIMHPIQVRLHHWFVPHRLVWDGWEDFITGGPDGNDASTIPQRQIYNSNFNTKLHDYFGVSQAAANDGATTVNALPYLGYNRIWNEFYRDQDLQSEVDPDTNNNVLGVSWEKDYFTTARPWPQKGEAVTLPLGTEADIRFSGSNLGEIGVYGPTGGDGRLIDNESGQSFIKWANTPPAGGGHLYTDLTNASAATVDDLRRAFALQRFAEARARYGSRYSEYLRYAYGVQPQDARLDRPEYLGGGKVNISISEVLQTAPETDSQIGTEFGVGDMYGHGIAALRSNAYRRTFLEHGYVFTLVSIRPKSIYMSGVPRHFWKLDREDFFQRELQHIGQQEVWNGELYGKAAASTLRETFGYQDRYREYKEQPSQVAGEFRDVLDYWHMARKFDAQPVLNASFIDCVPDNRVFNVQTNHVAWMAVQHRLVARRAVQRSSMSKIV